MSETELQDWLYDKSLRGELQQLGIKCSPHFAMGMVMLIEVGDASAPVLPADLPARARSRFEAILAAHPQ